MLLLVYRAWVMILNAKLNFAQFLQTIVRVNFGNFYSVIFKA